MTPGGASGYPTTLESLSHVADSLHTRRGRCETGEKETLRISTDYAGFFSYVVSTLDEPLGPPALPLVVRALPLGGEAPPSAAASASGERGRTSEPETLGAGGTTPK